MISPHKKRVVGIALTLLMAVVMWVIILTFNLFHNMDLAQLIFHGAQVEDKYDSVINTVRELEDSFEEAYDHFFERIQVKADLSAKALYFAVSEKGDESITKLTSGCVAKIENGDILLPEGVRTGLRQFTNRIKGERGTLYYDTATRNGTRKDILVYSHITGPYYYLEIVNGEELRDYMVWYVGYEDILLGMANAYDLDFALICPDPRNSRFFFNMPGNLLYYRGMKLGKGMMNAEDVGLSTDPDELIENSMAVAMNSGDVSVNIVEEIEELDCLFVIMLKENASVLQSVGESAVGVLMIAALCIVFLVWITSVYDEMYSGTMIEKKKEKYAPGKIRVIAVSYGIISLLIVFTVSLFIRSLNSLYQETNTLNNSITSLEFRLSQEQFESKQEDSDRKTVYVEYAQRMAEILERYPQLNNKGDLEELSRIVGARYVMIYDANGRQVSTSSDYINMELGAEDADPPASTADFRRILKGVPYIAHDAVRDEVTGRKLEMIGVRTNDLKNGGYGVLVIAMKPEERNSTDDQQINAILKSLIPAGKICFSVDPGDKMIVNSNTESISGSATSPYLGIRDSYIRGGVSDFMRIGGLRYYCLSKTDDSTGIIYYFGTPTKMLFESGYWYAVNCAIGYGIVFALLCRYLLAGYTDKALETAESSRNERMERKAPGKIGRVRSFIYSKIGGMTPEKKALLAARVLMTGFILFMFYNYSVTSAQTRDAFVFSYILEGRWNKGLNLFSFTAMILLLCVITLGMLFVRFVFGTIGNMMNPRGQTICKLLANMIGYLSILVYFYYALSYLGVNTSAILASVGVIGIGLSMGARDLIADIFAGISIIFEGEYQVGDIVSIDGYRGMVQEVGVRSTRIIGRGGNIKVIGNKDIKNVVNLTKLNSWVPVTIKVDVNYPLRDAEAILEEALPRVAEKCPEIISGPYYKGVLSVEMGFAVLSIIAECREGDYHQVERTLIREILLALREKNVPVR